MGCYTINEMSDYPVNYFANFYRKKKPSSHGHGCCQKSHKYYKFKNPCKTCGCRRSKH